jgi:hypothetical protein
MVPWKIFCPGKISSSAEVQEIMHDDIRKREKWKGLYVDSSTFYIWCVERFRGLIGMILKHLLQQSMISMD